LRRGVFATSSSSLRDDKAASELEKCIEAALEAVPSLANTFYPDCHVESSTFYVHKSGLKYPPSFLWEAPNDLPKK